MLLNVKFTSAYKKSYKLMKKRGLNLSLLDDAINTLRQGKALEEKYHDHELKGKLKVFWSSIFVTLVAKKLSVHSIYVNLD